MPRLRRHRQPDGALAPAAPAATRNSSRSGSRSKSAIDEASASNRATVASTIVCRRLCSASASKTPGNSRPPRCLAKCLQRGGSIGTIHPDRASEELPGPLRVSFDVVAVVSCPTAALRLARLEWIRAVVDYATAAGEWLDDPVRCSTSMVDVVAVVDCSASAARLRREVVLVLGLGCCAFMPWPSVSSSMARLLALVRGPPPGRLAWSFMLWPSTSSSPVAERFGPACELGACVELHVVAFDVLVVIGGALGAGCGPSDHRLRAAWVRPGWLACCGLRRPRRRPTRSAWGRLVTFGHRRRRRAG